MNAQIRHLATTSKLDPQLAARINSSTDAQLPEVLAASGYCPDCLNALRRGGGCAYCICGWSACF